MAVIASQSAQYKAARGILGDHRKVFDSVSAAIAALKTIFKLEGFPQEFPVVAASIGLIDVTGDDTVPPLADWPEAFTNDSVRICVSFLGLRGIKGEDGKESNGARGFVIYPLFSIADIQAADSGQDWLWKVVEKEASHVALRQLRNVNPALGTDALAQAAGLMPVSVDDYVEESTREGLDTSAFDGLWKHFRKMLGDSPNTAALLTALPQKAEVVKAIRSKQFAESEYADLEKMGVFTFIADSMASIIDHMKAQAIENGTDFDLNADDIRGWVKTRNEKVFAAPKKIEADLTTVNFGAFMSGLGVPSTDAGKTE